MRQNNRNKQEGFILITVMVLTMMAGTIVLTSLEDSVVQERLSGNFQKKINSRLMAENGAYNAYNAMINTMTSDSVEGLKVEATGLGIMEGGSGNSTYELNFDKLTEKSDAGNDLFSVTSTGNVHEGQTQLQAIYEFVPSVISPITSNESFDFSSGITGCKGITVAGGASIDSYDSSQGDYDENSNSNENVIIQTILDGDTKFSGGVTIDGDLISAGDVTFGGSASISGDVEVDGDISLSSGAADIGGNVSTSGSYTQAGGNVVGTVHADGDITISWATNGGNIISRQNISVTGGTIAGYLLALNNITLPNQGTFSGGAYTHGNFSQTGGTTTIVRAAENVSLLQWGTTITNDDLRYAGSGSFQGDHNGASSANENYTKSPYKVDEVPSDIPDVPAVELSSPIYTDSDGNVICDTHDIDNAVTEVDIEAGLALDLNIGGEGNDDPDGIRPSGQGNGAVYSLSQYNSEFTLVYDYSSTSPSEDVSSKSVEFLNQNYDMLMFNNVDIEGHLVVEAGQNVTMYVAGDFTMGGASSLTIPEDSSLTLIIKGKLIIGGGADTYMPDSGVTSEGVPVFTIFSSYDGDGITITGGNEEIYAVIYAPLTNVIIDSTSDFKGSILGNEVNVSGAGAIHYDEALGGAGLGGTSTTGGGNTTSGGSFIFQGWEYVTDPDTDS